MTKNIGEETWVPFSGESELRRNDPELKAKVAKVVKARQEALNQASALLKQATEILEAQNQFVGDAIYSNRVQSVSIASFSLSRDAEFASGNRGQATSDPSENDTYLGNLAAGQLGVQIQDMGDKFPM